MDTSLKTALDDINAGFLRHLRESFGAGENLLMEAMAYSLMAGGKRLRPALFLLAAQTYQAAIATLYPFALAIEMIHTYSLVHDDLPAMDDDEYRRGLPSCHKKYGEALAILAGDGLLTEAFARMASLRHQVDGTRLLAAIELFADFAGTGGMVKGQMLDICGEGKDLSLAQLREIHFYKTGALIKASLMSGALLGGAEDRDIAAFQSYGEELGLAFQITDDILDRKGDFNQMGKTAGSDSRHQKTTYISLLGDAGAQREAEAAVDRAKQAIAAVDRNSQPFLALADYVLTREH